MCVYDVERHGICCPEQFFDHIGNKTFLIVVLDVSCHKPGDVLKYEIIGLKILNQLYGIEKQFIPYIELVLFARRAHSLARRGGHYYVYLLLLTCFSNAGIHFLVSDVPANHIGVRIDLPIYLNPSGFQFVSHNNIEPEALQIGLSNANVGE